MPDNNQWAENIRNNEAPKKRSFFWWKLDIHTKDLLDFRYNTQEEIDKLNEEMTTTESLDEIIEKQNWISDEIKEDKENINAMDEETIKEIDTKKAESDLEKNLEWVEESNNNDSDNDNYDELYLEEETNNEAIEWEIVNNPYEEDKDENIDGEITNEGNNEDGNIDVEKPAERNEDVANKENDEKDEDKEIDENKNKFFDPFELDFYEEENDDLENSETNNSMFDPFGLNEEDNNEKIIDEENEEIIDNENEEIIDNENNDEVIDEESDDEAVDEENDDEAVDEENNDEVVDEENDDEIVDENNTAFTTPVNLEQKDENTEVTKNKKIKKNSKTWEIITDEEIQLEQWQDTPDSENDEEYIPSDDELFEREPEFFANDELSQQFMHLVQNTHGIFKLEHKNWEQNPYFKILWSKTSNSTIEYLFYLIEEEDEPIDLYIKKVETNQENWEENEHLVQFSYNEEKELNIFVDGVILYERINKSDSDSTEYNDTKSILEKFIFLTDNHYDKLKSELDKLLQQIFKGF